MISKPALLHKLSRLKKKRLSNQIQQTPGNKTGKQNCKRRMWVEVEEKIGVNWGQDFEGFNNADGKPVKVVFEKDIGTNKQRENVVLLPIKSNRLKIVGMVSRKTRNSKNLTWLNDKPRYLVADDILTLNFQKKFKGSIDIGVCDL